MKLHQLTLIILTLILFSCGSPANQSTSSSDEFYWLIKVTDQTSHPISNTKVSVQFPSAIPQVSKYTDNDGLAVFLVDATFDGEIITVTIEKDQYRSIHTVTVSRDKPPTEIHITP